jgi:hypothetical protein
MSRASEWVKNQEAGPTSEMFRSPNNYTVAASVAVVIPLPAGVAVKRPGLLITDSRGTQIHLNASDALALARWILDTFGEESA